MGSQEGSGAEEGLAETCISCISWGLGQAVLKLRVPAWFLQCAVGMKAGSQRCDGNCDAFCEWMAHVLLYGGFVVRGMACGVLGRGWGKYGSRMVD